LLDWYLGGNLFCGLFDKLLESLFVGLLALLLWWVGLLF